MKSISLYIHIPFCSSKCGYCDFLSFAGREEQIGGYLRALQSEACKFQGYTARTVFLGGGTPSILPEGTVFKLIEGIDAAIPIEAGAECTIEANPNTITKEKIREYRSAGLNRISIGLQSASDRLLTRIGRTHTYGDFCRSIELAAAAFPHINADMMYALPGQTIADVEETAVALTRFPIDHISAYALKIEEGTPFWREGVAPVPEELDREMYHRIVEILHQVGFSRYETSNFAKPGGQCRHNLAYWEMRPYLGLGLGAHSFLDGKRWENTRDFSAYVAAEGNPARTDLGAGGDLLEWVMLSLRLERGLDMAETERRYGRPAREEITRQAKRLEAGGFLIRNGERMTLTEKGFDLQNAVIVELIKNL